MGLYFRTIGAVDKHVREVLACFEVHGTYEPIITVLIAVLIAILGHLRGL